MNTGLQKYHHGRYEEARVPISRALEIYERYELRFLADKARQNLSGVLFASGHLTLAATGVRQLYLDATRRGTWRQRSHALFNLLTIAVLRGQLGAARRAAQELRRVAPRVERRESEQDSRYADALISLRLGVPHQAATLLNRGWASDDPLYGKVLALCGEAHLLLGDTVTGRDLFRRGISATMDRALMSDAAELLAMWLLCEVDLGERAKAMEILQEFSQHEPHCSVPVRTLLVLAEAEMAAEDWLDTSEVPGGVADLLNHAQLELSRCDMGYYTWRPSWRLGRLAFERAEAQRAMSHLDDARVLLIQLLRSVESERLSETMLALPATSRFLQDLEIKAKALPVN